jgi:post-segregation antitoxin (ccd killing protein)
MTVKIKHKPKIVFAIRLDPDLVKRAKKLKINIGGTCAALLDMEVFDLERANKEGRKKRG